MKGSYYERQILPNDQRKLPKNCALWDDEYGCGLFLVRDLGSLERVADTLDDISDKLGVLTSAVLKL